MASTFKNAGMTVGVVDNSSADLYTAGGSETAVVHAIYLSNASSANVAKVTIKVTVDGGSTFYHVGKNLEIPANNTLTLDKPINLENNDILRVVADPSPDSTSVAVEAVASILAIT